MIDPVSAAMSALQSHSPAAVGTLFVAGALTSVGPCVAPRYVAVTAIAGADRHPLVPTCAFISGLVAAFVMLGFAAGLLGSLWSSSHAMYLILAAGLIVGGGIALVRAAPSNEHACVRDAPRPAAPRSLAAIFLLGACSTLVISPCCTPIVTTIVATSTAIGQPLTGGILLLSYALGHALPLLFAGHFGGRLARIFPGHGSTQAVAIVGAVLMLALGCYYGVLA
jgi:cytochrome c biogenesis protein CcdA